MASINMTNPLEKKPPTILRCATSRPRIWRLRRKKKLPTVRLGGGQSQSQLQGGGSGSLMAGMIRRIRVRWMKLKKACALKKLKEYYLCVLKELTENDNGSFEKRQQLLLMESSFGIPVMGITFNAYN
ncbi:unnamed protein product [Lactuca virosa]|uniref:Uncharacterized protein n=1 Tax=Lactuca virosa TaxID=75947 RepID=A0AAU9MBQ0_9ASTR|nr:unnamed protein product [Lactuca virosa]